MLKRSSWMPFVVAFIPHSHPVYSSPTFMGRDAKGAPMSRLGVIVAVLGLGVGALILTAPAQATLIGDTVEACAAGPFPLLPAGPRACPTDNLFGTSPVTAEVTAGVEFTSAGVVIPEFGVPDTSKHIELDLGSESFTVTIFHDDLLAPNFQINGFELLLADLDRLPIAGEIAGVSLLGGNTLPAPTTLTWGVDSVTVVFPTFTLLHEQVKSAEFMVQFVPEPCTGLLFASGLAVLAVGRRRRAN